MKGPESGRSEGCITPQKARVVEMKLRQVGDSHKMGMGGDRGKILRIFWATVRLTYCSEGNGVKEER